MSRFVPNPRFLRQLRHQPEFIEGMGRRAEGIKARAKLLTPRSSDRRRGHFRDRFVVETTPDGIPRVGNTDKSFYHLIEFGSVNNTPAAPLRRAVRAEGLRMDEQHR
jgi:hypothetical protein